ncbi:uncharacterized protein LOC126607872 [Malus sylvestris]|uniref:uncharacterized protein LOC126607872 n=1 Tax=Malus sylvestris TaxID=3752 RepID=UPI0021ABAEA7|nr:uncharacterized protein LOC126607872 [Malus sylvestris]
MDKAEQFFKLGCLSHKIADAATLRTFIRSWAASAFGADQRVVNPLFNSVPMANQKTYQWTHQPLRYTTQFCDKEVEALAALVWKRARNASRITLWFSSRPAAFYQNVNIRNRVVPPVPNESVGNFVGGGGGEGKGFNNSAVRPKGFCLNCKTLQILGGGEPMWVSSAVPTCNNMVILVDAEDGDGRVLGEIDIRRHEVFECDQELLLYASFKPNVWETG